MRIKLLSLGIIVALLSTALIGCTQNSQAESTPVLLRPSELIPTSEGTLLFEDNFENPEQGWDISLAGRRPEATYTRGEIVLQRTSNVYGHYAYARPHLAFDNTILEVSGRWAGGAVGGTYGVLFRYQNERNYYAFRVGNDGRYVLGKREMGVWTGLLTGFDAAIGRMGEINRIHLEVVGQEIRCFVNGVYVGGLRDSTHTLGDVALALWLPEGTDWTSAAFDDIVIARYP